MATASLSASSRTGIGKGVARKLRAEGKVPGVVYGHAREPQSLSLDQRELERLLERITAASTVIDLSIDGAARRTLIRDIQRHPLRRSVLHIDFQELVAGEKVTVAVPLVFEGTPVGVRADGGVFTETIHELEIECDPSDIPEHITIDVTELAVGHSMHVSDVVLPAGVALVTDAGITICICSPPRVEEAPASPEDAEASAEPEVIRRAKDDDAEGEED